VICAASYEARRFGVHAALSTHVARARCPQLILVEPRHGRYSEISHQVMGLLDAWSPIVEQVSVDEAYLDLAGTQQLHGNAHKVARVLKRAVSEATGLTISVGGGASKLVAKIASGASKPDGLLIVERTDQSDWLAPLPVSVIPGIGPVAQQTLRELDITTCGELARAPEDHLLRRFGARGPDLKRLAVGEDESPVDPGDNRKSLGREMTLDEDVADPHALETLLLDLVESVSFSLRREGLLARTVTLKLKDTEFVSITRQVTLAQPSALSGPIYEAARTLLKRSARGEPFRLIGVSASELGDTEQLSLFDVARAERDRAVTRAADRMREKYGDDVVTRARLISPSDDEGEPNDERP
jgi:DNA polymerase-4